MRVKIKLSLETLSDRSLFDDVSCNHDVSSKLSYDNGVWAEIAGNDNDVIRLMCDLCNNLVAE